MDKVNIDQVLDKVDVNQFYDIAMKVGGKVLLFILGLLVTWTAAKWISTWVRRSLAKTALDPAIQIFISKLLKWTVFTLGIITCLGVFGVETASFAAILASAGFAVGMALQGTLGNFASGVMLLLFRPFKIGDVITTDGLTGTVAEIDIFSTALDTPDNRRIIIPNNSVFSGKIENATFHNTRRVDVIVGTEYSANIDIVRKALMLAASSTKNISTSREPGVVLTDLGESSINWSVRVWCDTKDYWKVKDLLTENVKVVLDKQNIGIPFPQMDIHLDK